MKPGIDGVRTRWNQGFMAFRIAGGWPGCGRLPQVSDRLTGR